MIFGDTPLSEAAGTILAHSLKIKSGVIKKGTRLTDANLTSLKEAGYNEIVVARLEPGDIPEDEAAARLARALCGYGLARADASTGRANIHSARDGVLLIDYDRINRINILDERITVATLEPFAAMSPRQLAATVKIIPYAVPEFVLNQAMEITKNTTPVLRVKDFRKKKIALVMSRLSDGDNKLLEKGKRATAERLARFGSSIDSEITVSHTVKEIAKALVELSAGNPDLILVLGATAIADRSDVVPSAVTEAGGKIEQFGMPVDPGNLLLLGQIGEIKVVGIPGCARSPKLNGFDWVLERLHADLTITSRDIARMGVGGLLKEIPSRPQPREADKSNAKKKSNRKVYGLILAAGQSRRMGKDNKLLSTLGEKPLIKHVADALTATSVEGVYVVTGHESTKIEKELSGKLIQFVHNPLFASGLSSTLKKGVAALPEDADGVLVCLGDMPLTGSEVLEALINTFNEAPSESICIPTFEGKNGNPVLWPRSCFSEIMELEGDVGARALIGLHADIVEHVPVDNPSIFIDVDTASDLRQLID